MAITNRLEEPVKKVGSLLDEFKAFAFKGNVIDLAIGVIIGAAFGAIINSLVKDIIMPTISIILPGNASYENWKWVVGGQMVDGKLEGAKEILFGKFLAEVVNFLIVALALFIFIKKLLGWLMRAKKEEVAAVPPPTKEQELLTEIRDLLKQRAA
jgi:large conductance mechanosensitive channel